MIWNLALCFFSLLHATRRIFLSKQLLLLMLSLMRLVWLLNHLNAFTLVLLILILREEIRAVRYLTKSRVQWIFSISMQILVDLCSHWVYLDHGMRLVLVFVLFFVLFFPDLFLSLPPAWVYHLFLHKFSGNSCGFLSQSFKRVLSYALSPSRGGSPFRFFSFLRYNWLLYGWNTRLFSLWGLNAFVGKFLIIQSYYVILTFVFPVFELNFWYNLDTICHRLLFFQQVFIGWKKSLHSIRRFMSIKLLLMASINIYEPLNIGSMLFNPVI